MWMSLRRFTRLTNAFNKEVGNHVHAFLIYSMHYNVVRIRQMFRVLAVTAAGVTDPLWELGDMGRVVEEWEAARGRAGP